MKTHIFRKLGDSIDTDQIIASQYLLLPEINEMKKYAFETIDPGFASEFKPGSCIVAGKNFGCGSSREQAPAVIKAMGVSAVIAKSFARIFFRNGINIGLPLIECAEMYDDVTDGEELIIDFENSQIQRGEKIYIFKKYPAHVSEIISAGGLIELINSKRMEVKQ